MSLSDAKSRRAVLLLAALALLSACQPPPRPFAHGPGEAHGPNPILDLSDSGGVVVLAVSGMAGDHALAMAERMAKALREHEVPAATGTGNSRSRFLQGWVSVTPATRNGIDVAMEWDLFEPDGTLIGSRKVRRTTDRKHWEDGDGALFDALAYGAAGEIVALVRNPTPVDTAAALYLPLHVAAVTGAPGNGGAALRKAMAVALDRRGFRLSAGVAPDGLIVVGRVRLGPVRDGTREVEIVWAVRRTDGKQLGSLTQNNVVAAGSFEKDGWDRIASAVADGAAGGLHDLLGRLSPDVLPARRPRTATAQP